MKKHCLLLVAGFLLSVQMYGQGETQPLITRSALEYNAAQSLWFNSSNAAGLTITPLNDYSIVSADYQHTSGDYKRQQEGDKKRDVVFNATGALQIGKIALWGNFTYSDDYITGSTYNTNRYEAASDMPYYVADPNKSDWQKQYYDMSVKVATPIGNRFAIGGDINYITKKAAKQLDPRSVINAYSLTIAPSFTAKLGNHQTIGINGLYSKSFDRNNFTNSVGTTDQNVYVMTGLGNYSTGIIGGLSSIGVFYYSGIQYGGGLQYGYQKGNNTLLLDVTYSTHKIDANEKPVQPHKIGSTNKTILDGKLQAIHTGKLTHKLTAEFYLGNTNGIEYVQQFIQDYEVKHYITLAQHIRSTYQIQNISLSYDLFAGTGNDYSWRAGLNAAYNKQDDEYVVPVSWFNASNASTEVFAKKNFQMGKSQHLLVGGKVGYKTNLSGEYFYSGEHGPESSTDPWKSLLVTDFYPKELAYLTANYTHVGLSADWAWITQNKSSVNIGIEWQFTKPNNNSGDRTYIGGSVAYIF